MDWQFIVVYLKLTCIIGNRHYIRLSYHQCDHIQFSTDDYCYLFQNISCSWAANCCSTNELCQIGSFGRVLFMWIFICFDATDFNNFPCSQRSNETLDTVSSKVSSFFHTQQLFIFVDMDKLVLCSENHWLCTDRSGPICSINILLLFWKIYA